MAMGYMIEIQPSVSDSYGVKQGWDKVYDTRAEAEAAKDRAERNDWHSVRVITIERARYTWRTDAASGEVLATDEDDALAQIVAQTEWARLNSEREQRDIADGAWLTIFDVDGIAVLRRGTMP